MSFLTRNFTSLSQSRHSETKNASLAAELFFLADTLERCSVFLAIHELTGIRIALGPCLCLGIIGLRTLFYCAVSVTVAPGGWLP